MIVYIYELGYIRMVIVIKKVKLISIMLAWGVEIWMCVVVCQGWFVRH